jgi:hypothetical protein
MFVGFYGQSSVKLAKEDYKYEFFREFNLIFIAQETTNIGKTNW